MPDITKLINAARDAYPERSKASTELSLLGVAALPAVMEALKQRSEHGKTGLWHNVLAEMSDDVVPSLAPYAAADSSTLRVAALARLSACRDDRALEPLLALAETNGSRATLEALGNLGNAKAIDCLREIASSLVGEIGDPAGLEAALVEARSEDYAHELRVLITLAVALAKLGDHSLGYVVTEMTKLDRGAEEGLWEAYVVRAEAVKALENVMVDGASELLIEAMTDPDPEVRENAIDASLYLGSVATVPGLLGALHDDFPDNAQRAGRVLSGLLGEDLEADADGFAAQCQERAATLAGVTCVRFGRPLEIDSLFPYLGQQPTFHAVRHELELITGVNFAPTPMGDWGLDLDGEAHARAWWKDNADRFEPGRLYRRGVLVR